MMESTPFYASNQKMSQVGFTPFIGLSYGVLNYSV